jgi:hypothetical protein
MGKFSLLDNYSADPSIGKMGGLTAGAGAAAGGGLDIGSIIGSLLPMLMGGMSQGSEDKTKPQESVIGGSGGSHVQAQMPQFNRPPSMGALIAKMLETKRGY